MVVASIWADHPLHQAAKSWLLKGRSGELKVLVCQHSLVEVYVSLIGMPTRPKLGPAAVHAALSEARKGIKIVELNPADYLECVERGAAKGLSGGICYDLLIMRAAQKGRADKLLTANPRDFSRLWEGEPSFIQAL